MSRFTNVEDESLLDKPIKKSLGRVQILKGLDLISADPHAPFFSSGAQRFLSILNIESDDSLGEMVTVYMQAQPADSEIVTRPSAKFISFFVARLEWGNGGFQTQCEVDIVNGQAFSVAAGFLRVTVGPDPQFDIAGIPPDFGDFGIAIGAHVSYGTRPAQALSPTRTLRVPAPAGVIAAAATSAIFAIPRFARSLLVVSQPDPTPTHPDVVQFLNGTGGAIYQRNLANTPGLQIPIALDAKFFTITNNGAAAKSYHFIFELAL